MKTVHCVGLRFGEWKNYLLLQDVKSSGIRILRVVLDTRSSFLTSPFYQHDITLSDEVDGAHELDEWHQMKLRVNMDSDRSEMAYVAEVKNIIRHSFFPMLLRTTTVTNWQRECYSWDVFSKGLANKYQQSFSLDRWLKEATITTTSTSYWNAYKEVNAEQLKVVIDSLGLDKSSAIVGSLPFLYCLMDRWSTQKHIAGYFKYRLMEMPMLWRLTPMNFSSLQGTVIRDMILFMDHLTQSVATPPPLPPPKEPDYSDFTKFVTRALIKNWKYIPTTRKYRSVLIQHVLVRYTLESCERRLKEDLSTVYPITVKILLWNFNYIFGIKSDLSVQRVFDLSEINVVEEEEEEGEKENEYEGLSEKDYREIIKESLDYFPPELLVPINDRSQIKMNTPLALLRKKEANEMEEKLREVYQEKLANKETRLFTVSEWNTKQWIDSQEELSFLYEQRFSMIQSTVVECLQSRDLMILSEIFKSAIWDCLILRPEACDYSLLRTSLYFSDHPDIVLEDFHERFTDIKTALTTMNDVLLPELIVILDCHLLSVPTMKILMEWFSRKHETVKRIVMMSVEDALPLAHAGQAFVDLLQWSQLSPMSAGLFNHDHYHDTLMCAIDHFPQLHLSDKNHPLSETIRPQILPLRRLVRLYVLISEQEKLGMKYQKCPTLDTIKDLLTLKFISKHAVRLLPMTLSKLPSLVRTGDDYGEEWVLFLITEDYLKKLSRNEMNHLLLMTGNLTVVATTQGSVYSEKKRKGVNWFKKMVKKQQYPNIRYTLPYAKKLMIKVADVS